MIKRILIGHNKTKPEETKTLIKQMGYQINIQMKERYLIIQYYISKTNQLHIFQNNYINLETKPVFNLKQKKQNKMKEQDREVHK